MQPTVLLCGYSESEQNIWKFLLRKLPNVRLLPVEEKCLGLTLERLLTGGAEEEARGKPLSDRLVVFAGAEGLLLSQLIDISGQVGRAYKAVATKTNLQWTLPELLEELKREEAALGGK